ncbi:MAG: hypothetical protein PHY39_08040 [Endomicrobiaceae bacterium]|nr:hypothetical protein [Endomicrobiaceae bacterium]
MTKIEKPGITNYVLRKADAIDVTIYAHEGIRRVLYIRVNGRWVMRKNDKATVNIPYSINYFNGVLNSIMNASDRQKQTYFVTVFVDDAFLTPKTKKWFILAGKDGKRDKIML